MNQFPSPGVEPGPRRLRAGCARPLRHKGITGARRGSVPRAPRFVRPRAPRIRAGPFSHCPVHLSKNEPERLTGVAPVSSALATQRSSSRAPTAHRWARPCPATAKSRLSNSPATRSPPPWNSGRRTGRQGVEPCTRGFGGRADPGSRPVGHGLFNVVIRQPPRRRPGVPGTKKKGRETIRLPGPCTVRGGPGSAVQGARWRVITKQGVAVDAPGGEGQRTPLI